MTAERDLIFAILSMDSYNRGYGAGLKNLPVSGLLGNATILTDASSELDANAVLTAGFYAIAYEWQGQTVIAYRGTDDPKEENVGGDVWNGWITGAGIPGPQAKLAIKFYRTLVGVNANDVLVGNPLTANIALTGHSLGGGLAGYVSSLYVKQAVAFDNMPFELSSRLVNSWAKLNEFSGFGDTKTYLYGTNDVPDIDRSTIKAYETEGEVLKILRTLGGQSTPVETLNSNGGFRSPVDLHSMALLTLLLWNKKYGNTDWVAVGGELWDSYFNADVGKSITGISDRIGENSQGVKIIDEAAAMGRMIAYSAIDEGERPFGDTGIWSLFNDAGDLGRGKTVQTTGVLDRHVTVRFNPLPIVGGPSIVPDLIDLKQALAEITVQYAGALALYDVETADVRAYNSDLSGREGVLGLSSDESILALDASSILWKDVFLQGNSPQFTPNSDPLKPINFDAVSQFFFDQSEETRGDIFNLIKTKLGSGGASINAVLANDNAWPERAFCLIDERMAA